MTTGLERPTVPGEISAVKQRVTAIERQLKDRHRAGRPDKSFSLGGPIYESVSCSYYPPSRVAFAEIVVALRVPTTSGTVTCRVLVNDVVAKTVELPAGQRESFHPAEIVAKANDRVNVELTAVGVGGQDFTCILRA